MVGVKFRALIIGDYVIPVNTIRSIDYIDYTHIIIEYGAGCYADLQKDDYSFVDWDFFVRHLNRIFEL
ncbi:MAG: hypothetical protein GX638_18700 [Crenarchaeota archaeon]|nr:hypothetical protein [Thermoproteota archaeon]